MRDAVRDKADILLVLGYTTASVFFPFMRFGKCKLITNMDGLEWKRDKWSETVKRLALWFEKLGANNSDFLVSDNEKIRDYLLEKYGKDSTFIPYGCEPFQNPEPNTLERYGVSQDGYSILIARMEAENNVDMILDGYIHSKCPDPLLVVGNMVTKYASDLIEKYGHDKRVRFMGGIYNQNDLNNLRYFAKYYFHGHSVGGTNPSLLEAMASSVYIVAHGNEFNKAVLGDDGSFFLNRDEVTRFVDNFKKDQKVPAAIASNLEKVKSKYNWKLIADAYEKLFHTALQQSQSAIQNKK